MRLSLKEALKDCLVDLKRTSGPRDKWVRAWPGQVCLFLAFLSCFFFFSYMIFSFTDTDAVTDPAHPVNNVEIPVA